MTTVDGISGLGSAYTGSKRMLEVWQVYRYSPERLHKAQDEMAIPTSAIHLASGGKNQLQSRIPGLDPLDVTQVLTKRDVINGKACRQIA